MAKSKIAVTGIKAIDKKLRKLEAKVANQIVRRSMRESLGIVKAAVESNAPIDTGLMASAVKIRALKRSRKRIGMEVHIASKTPGLKVTSASGETVFYPAIVQYGKRGQPPNPFITRAYDAKGPKARDVAIKKIIQGVEREAAS